MLQDGRFLVGDKSIGITELLAATGQAVVEGEHESNFVFPNGCYTCEVEVDPDTGVVTIVKFSGVDDVGTVVHPKIVHGQVYGSIEQEIAQALQEEIIYDETGQLITASFPAARTRGLAEPPGGRRFFVRRV